MSNPAPQFYVRLALLGVVSVLVQIAGVSQVTLLGVSADLSPLVVASVGLLCGSIVGAVFGFGMGLFVDTALLQTLGVSSLVLLSIGYLAGRYREGFDVTSPLLPAALAGALTLLATGGFAIVQVMLGVDAPVSLLVLRELVVQSLLGFLLAFPIYPLVRRILRAALVEDTRSRGRLPIPFRTAQ